MSTADVEKICVSCGANVAHQGRHKDRQGEYWCLPCHRAHRQSQDAESASHAAPVAEASQGLRRCACCGVEVPRAECHKNRHAEYICLKCVESGNTVSRRRWLDQLLQQSRKAMLYLVIVVLGCCVFWKILAKMNEPPSDDS